MKRATIRGPSRCKKCGKEMIGIAKCNHKTPSILLPKKSRKFGDKTTEGNEKEKIMNKKIMNKNIKYFAERGVKPNVEHIIVNSIDELRESGFDYDYYHVIEILETNISKRYKNELKKFRDKPTEGKK